MMKPFSTACERNKSPILNCIKNIFTNKANVLEIGSGTGQHAVYFAQNLPHLLWQTSDMDCNHPAIEAWIEESDLPNILLPISLDINNQHKWPKQKYRYLYTSNTCHIMSWEEVEKMFLLFGSLLEEDSHLCIYGPFNYNHQFTSESNARFDYSLKNTNPAMGIRDIEKILECAETQGLSLTTDYDMPANNRLLHFKSTN